MIIPITNQPFGIAQCIEFYLDDCLARGQSNTTAITKAAHLNYFLTWCRQHELNSISECNIQCLEEYRKTLFRYRKKRNGQPLSLTTQRLRLMAVTSMLDRFYYFGYLNNDDFRRFDLPTVPKRLPKSVPSIEEVEQVLKQTLTKGNIGIRDRAILEVYYATGIRRAELAGLNLQDIDFNQHIITIRQGKGGTDRRVPIAERALVWVKTYLRENRPRLANFESGDALFLGSRGSRIKPGKLSELASNYIQRSGIGKTGSCHLFRHATATHMMQNGADIRYVQEMLGHKHLSSTQIYTHVTIIDLQRIYHSTHPASQLNAPMDRTQKNRNTVVDNKDAGN